MNTVKALRLHEDGGSVRSELEDVELDEIGEGDLLIRVEYSAINYKDALAVTGKGAIAKKFPLIAGIDLAGTVEESTDERFAAGDKVLVCGAGLGETRDGGYAQYARVPADLAVAMPEGLDARSAMIVGTAGFTAALAVTRLEQCGQTPELGPIAVTGATGGVGSFAIDLMSARGYSVTAVTGKTDERAYLESLGAVDVVDRETLLAERKPLAKAVWGGAVDNLGGDVLAALLASVRPGGSVASIGLAAGPKLQTTVFPFILRGVSLLGIDSVHMSGPARAAVWQRIASDLKPRQLAAIDAGEIALEDVPQRCEALIAGSHRGRTLVRIGARD